MGGPGCEQPSKERVRGSLLKRPSIRELAAFHLLRFAPDSLSLASFILHPPMGSRSRSSILLRNEFVEPRTRDRDREKMEYFRVPSPPFRDRSIRPFRRKFRGSGDQTSLEESLVSHGTLLPPIATSRLSLSRSVLFLSKERRSREIKR